MQAGTTIAAVVAVAAVVAAAWPTLVEVGSSVLETLTVTLNELPENQVKPLVN